MVPQETCVLVACDTADEAHYLCAMLNSSVSAFLARASSVDGGKGFGTPGTLNYLNIRRFDPSDPRHRELADLGRQQTEHRHQAGHGQHRGFTRPVEFPAAADATGNVQLTTARRRGLRR